MTIRALLFAAMMEICVPMTLSPQSFPMPPAGPPGPATETTQQLLKSRSAAIEISDPGTLVFPGQAQGTWQALIILIDFPDYPWNHQSDSNFPNVGTIYTSEHYTDMLFSLGTYKDPHSQSAYTGSMRDFYLENSYGQFDLTGVTTKWYTASQPMSYYANNNSGRGSYPQNSQRLVEEAVLLADPDVDFSQFDNNGDGVVDALFVVHAGPGAEQIYTENFAEHDDYLWSLKSSINTRVVDGGIQVRGFTVEPENGTIGVFCHEFGHELGLPDLYDGDNSTEGIGEWCLMSSGGWCYRAGDQLGTSPAHFSAWSKAQLGWLQPINVTENLTALEIPPAVTHPVAYRVWRNGAIGPEYFLIENRQLLGFDASLTRRQKDFGFAEPFGLIIYHVDNLGRQNSDSRRRIDVEEASPLFTETGYLEQLDLQRLPPSHQFLYNGNRGDNGDLFPGFSLINAGLTDFLGVRDRDVFNAMSIPNSNDNAGVPTDVSISNIRQVGENMVADIAIQAVTAVAEDADGNPLPVEFRLSQNYPNPFNPSTTIQYSIPSVESEGVHINLSVYNLKGELVRVLFSESRLPGDYTLSWDGTNDQGDGVASGVYYYRMQTGSFLKSRKMLVIR
ncbi:MAG TPA: M6 family metalloprotease domain-containing protein [bacterium]